MEPYDCIFVMGSVHRVMKAEKVLGGERIPLDMRPSPRQVSADCGMVIALAQEEVERARTVLAEAGIPPREIWIREKTGFVLRSRRDSTD